jgi:hypothetical protein
LLAQTMSNTRATCDSGSTTSAAGFAVRLATGPQLYMLNRADWLELRSTPNVNVEITNQAADSRYVLC